MQKAHLIFLYLQSPFFLSLPKAHDHECGLEGKLPGKSRAKPISLDW